LKSASNKFAVVLTLAALTAIGFSLFRSRAQMVDYRNPNSILKRADALSWNNNWIKAEPLYRRAELLYLQQQQASKALYANVSQIPPNAESSSLANTIFQLSEDLTRPEASDPETRLRILTERECSRLTMTRPPPGLPGPRLPN
jgi:hypothetical protein